MFRGAPRTLVILLALVITSKVIFIALSNGPLLPRIIWPALFAALSLSALFGKRSAATMLGYLFYGIGALSLLLVVMGSDHSVFGIVTSAIWGVLVIGTARYIFKSKKVRAFYAVRSSMPSATDA